MMSDSSIEKLKNTPGRKFKLANDPPSYDILSDQVYLNHFQFVHHHVLTKSDPKQSDLSDQITRALFGAFTTTHVNDFTLLEATNLSGSELATYTI